MSYRKIIVDGNEYEYTVGKTHIKIKGMGVFPKEEHGIMQSHRCECCGERLVDLYPNRSEKENCSRAITPVHIEGLIRSNQ
jgi:hypothetical protein